MPATAVEQMILELIKRARRNLVAEAARDGIDPNEGSFAGGNAGDVPMEQISKFRTIASFNIVATLDLGNTPTLLASVDGVSE